ncbi:hypothetical protein MRX96_038706 [Rhipicephalus microplus]
MVSRKSFRSCGGLPEAGRSFKASSTQQIDDAAVKFFMMSDAFSHAGAQWMAHEFSTFGAEQLPAGEKVGRIRLRKHFGGRPRDRQ